MKPYQFALLLGRFQILHLGHEDMIQKALACSERVGIFIGSSQESGTSKNPLSYEQRAEVFRSVFGDSVEVKPLPDIGVGNNSTWGDYVLDTAESSFGCLPDLVVSGKENRRSDWFDNSRGQSIAELFIPKTVNISATEMRQYLKDGNMELWKRYTDIRLLDMYPLLRDAVLKAEGHDKTQSI